MGWLHDISDDEAFNHEGWAAKVLDDGTDTSSSSNEIDPHVTGWRPACECDWRGSEFYPRAEFPAEYGFAPDIVGERCRKAWEAHLHDVAPEFAVYDLSRALAQLQEDLDAAVLRARTAGASWTTIGRAAGVTRQSAHERWSDGVV